MSCLGQTCFQTLFIIYLFINDDKEIWTTHLAVYVFLLKSSFPTWKNKLLVHLEIIPKVHLYILGWQAFHIFTVAF